MLPFTVTLRPGLPIYEQVIYAVTRAIVAGQMQEGDAFPSVRALSQELGINPNTAHKIVGALIDQGLLTVRPGIGTIVAAARRGGAQARRLLLDGDVERIVVEARRTGVELEHVLDAIRRHWARTAGKPETDDRKPELKTGS